MRRRFPFTPVLVFFLLPLGSLLLAGLGCEAPAPERAEGPLAAAAAARGDTLSGSALAAIFGCGACHAGTPAPLPARDLAPPLNGLSVRWEPLDLVEYLVDPWPLREGVLARMPDYHLERPEASAVAMHLLRDDASSETRSALSDLGREHPGATAERGAAIVDALNCAGCHRGTGTEPWSPAPPLSSIRDRVRPDWLPDYLAAPTAVRPFGYYPGSGSRMPDFDLSPAEADSLAVWVVGDAPEVAVPEGSSEPGSQGDSEPGSQGDSERSSQRASSSDTRAKRLLEDHLACLGCHSLEGAGGRIAPALDDVAARRRPGYLRRIVHAPARAIPGTMMPAPLEDSATIDRVVAHLGREVRPGGSSYLSLVDHRPVRPDLSGSREPAALYAVHCAACHGGAGTGDGFNAAYLPRPPTQHADSGHMSTRPDDTLFDGIHGGGHILGLSRRMPAFGETLTSAEIRGLVRHLRELCRCVQPAWAESP